MIATLEREGRCLVERFGDVYRALARIGRSSDHKPDAILVCVDELTPQEDEFFELAARCCRGTQIAVHGSHAARVERALRMGMRDIRSADELRDWLEMAIRTSHARPTAPSVSPASVALEQRSALDTSVSHAKRSESDPVGPVSDAAPGATEAPLAPPINPVVDNAPPPVIVAEVEDGEFEVEPGTDAFDDSDSLAQPVRVPWLRYDGGPERASPEIASRQGEPPVKRKVREPRKTRSYEPLLTDEELRALIGDDLSSLGPERGSVQQNEVEREEGSA